MRSSNGYAGYSLVEIIIVIAILSILAGIAGAQFNQWVVKNNVEAQVKQMATDISELRVRALTTKLRHSVILYDNYYVFKSYSSETFTTTAELIANGTVLSGNHTVKYGLVQSDNTSFTGLPIEINQRGMLANLPQTVFLGNGASTSQAAVNCLTIHTVRVNIGKQNGTNCDDK